MNVEEVKQAGPSFPQVSFRSWSLSSRVNGFTSGNIYTRFRLAVVDSRCLQPRDASEPN